MSNSLPPNQIKTREELIYALSLAAELEHGLTCIYLYTAFTGKRYLEEGIDTLQQNQIRNWLSLIFSVARQEMEHLGNVCNLLNAIGAPMHFNRPNFPQSPSYYGTEGAFKLERFNRETIARFMEFEKPAANTSWTAELSGDQLVPEGFKFPEYHTVQELYDTILHGFRYLDAKLGSDVLFNGNCEAQIIDDDIVVGFNNSEFGIDMVPVTDLASAECNISRIVEQGEGVHFDEMLSSPKKRKFHLLYQQLLAEEQAIQELAQQFLVEEVEELSDINVCWRKKGEKLVAQTQAIHLNLFAVQKLLDTNSREFGWLQRTMDNLLGFKQQVEDLIQDPNPEQPVLQLYELCGLILFACKYNAEGVILNGYIEPGCHYLKFWQIYEEMQDIYYEPARNCVQNPALRRHRDNLDKGDLQIITYPYSRDMLEFFNAGYETMVQMLILVFSFNQITTAQRTLLINTAFFPLMTMFIRPVGEILCLLPAFKGDPKGEEALRAGPSFEYYMNTALLPQREPGWNYLTERLQEMVEFCPKIKNVPADLSNYVNPIILKKIIDQVSYICTNVNRISENFRAGIEKKPCTKKKPC